MTILLDCGWDIHFDTALLEPLREVVKRIDLVLISHPDLEHLGVSKRGRSCDCAPRRSSSFVNTPLLSQLMLNVWSLRCCCCTPYPDTGYPHTRVKRCLQLHSLRRGRNEVAL